METASIFTATDVLLWFREYPSALLAYDDRPASTKIGPE